MSKNIKIGFIGQGWIGKNYANNFEDRGYEVIRYAREEQYAGNKDKIKDCPIVFIAVPTPTTPGGFDDSILKEVLSLIGDGNIAIIKSTIIPGTTEKFQKLFPDKIILHSPEFLTEATAKYDAEYPDRNILGYVDGRGAKAAEEVMETLPIAPYKAIIPVKEAEMIKYAGNVWFYWKVIYINMLYDLCKAQGINYEVVKKGMSYDPRIGFTHLDPIHQDGRGAGGHCFIKDFAAFVKMYRDNVDNDFRGYDLLRNLEEININYLKESGKNLDLLEEVYGN